MSVNRRQVVEIAGMLLLAGAAFFLHPAAAVAVLGLSLILLANFGDWSGDNAGRD